MSRLRRLASLLEEPLLVAGPPYVLGGQANVRYLTGLQSSNSAVLVEPDGSATLYTDFRYANRARALEGVDVTEVARGLIPAIGELLSRQADRVRGAAPPARALPRARRRRGRRGPSAGLVEGLRAVKDAEEIAIMRRASGLSDEIFAALATERFSGRRRGSSPGGSSGASARQAQTGCRSKRWSAAGATAASPHAVPGHAPIEPGVLVTVDAGCVVDGYCSDCTRTFAVGEVSGPAAGAATRSCLEAQLAGLAAVAPGVHGRDADAASRSVIEAAGLGAAYGHGMGHGVGLQIHEAPTLRPESTDASRRGTSSPSSRGSTCRTRAAASGSRTSSSSPRTAASGSRSSRRS